MVANVADSFANKTKFRNKKEATISYGNEEMIKLRNYQSDNSLTKNWISFKVLRCSTSGLQTKVVHR